MSFTGAARTILLSLPMLAMTAWMLFRGGFPPDNPTRAAALIIYAAFNAGFALAVHTRKTDRWRSPLFIAYGLFFCAVIFTERLLEVRLGQNLPTDFMFEEGLPLCHIALSLTLIPAALTNTLFWPGTVAGFYGSAASVLATWLGGIMILGRGWCSWGCFFGGFDDGFSRILKKPLLKSFPSWLPNLPPALLIICVLLSAAALFPVYCVATCPFKTVLEYPVLHGRGLVFSVISFIFFITFVAVLPLLLKRRAQCSFLCPAGVLGAAASCLSPFKIAVNKGVCVKCGTCVANCPLFAMKSESLVSGSPGNFCSRCGICVDNCPTGAARFAVKGLGASTDSETARLLFLYPAFFLLTALCGNFCIGSIARIVKLYGGLP